MSRKLEIRTRMAEVQKEFSALNGELKELENAEKMTINRDKYQDYKFKVGTYGYTVEGEEKIQDATDEDREVAGAGKSGLVYTGFDGRSDFGYVLLKEKSDYARTVRVLQIIDAVHHLADDKERDKEKYIKIVLGEQTDEAK
jgi:hypothetical protein